MRFSRVILSPIDPDKTDKPVRILGTIIYFGAGGSYWLIKCGTLVAFYVNVSLRIKMFSLVESNGT